MPGLGRGYLGESFLILGRHGYLASQVPLVYIHSPWEDSLRSYVNLYWGFVSKTLLHLKVSVKQTYLFGAEVCQSQFQELSHSEFGHLAQKDFKIAFITVITTVAWFRALSTQLWNSQSPNHSFCQLSAVY